MSTTSPTGRTKSSRQPATTGPHSRRFRELRRKLDELDYFCKGTVLKRMMKCGKAKCACHSDPAKRHGPYFEWTYKVNGKTVNVKLAPETAPLYQAASRQHNKLKALLDRLERLSLAALRSQAKQARSPRNK